MMALTYAKLGLAVFACHYPVINGEARCSCGDPACGSNAAKHPYPRHAPRGFHNASKDPRVIKRWCIGPCNVAIATGAVSGVVVLDIDPRHGGDESLARLEAEHGACPITWRALTGGGGEHLYFRHPGRQVPCSHGEIAPGIDIKADGGYVIAPPSTHISGRRYAWDVDRHPEHAELAALPAWLTPKITSPDAAPKRDWKQFLATPIIDGTRHNAMKSLAGLLFYRLAREPHLAAELLVAFNQQRCSPPLEDEEVIKIIDWATAREIAKRRPG